MSQADTFETHVPARLDRLPWSRFHWLVVAALGATWILDGLETAVVGSLSGVIAGPQGLGLGDERLGDSASIYLAGAVSGALFFGWLTDRIGRKPLFTLTVLTYVTGSILSGLAWNFHSFAACRALAGFGIGGEYVAVNVAIQEFIPARYRGFTDMTIGGSFWLGAALGSLGSSAIMRLPVPVHYAWRAAFLIGSTIGFVVLALRRSIPESPRWLMTHGRPEEADRVVQGLEDRVHHETGERLPPMPHAALRLRRHEGGWFGRSLRALLTQYRGRTALAATLLSTQSFCYNAIFFTYALVLGKFYGVTPKQAGLYMLTFALGNFAGPITLGKLFDVIGRRPMIVATYTLSGVMMIGVGALFVAGWFSALGQTVALAGMFFFASAASSSAYLTVGESFPLEVRAVAIAVFYAIGTLFGGTTGPALFGRLIHTGHRIDVFYGYALGGALMLFAAVMEWLLGPAAERRTLEDVARPLSAA